MGSNKKDLEIIYHLQWKNGNGTGRNEKSNIVGMYDIPATTLNWETFKSYLLKNSGAVVDDVKVSYVSTDDKEFPIESQLDFQIALYSFRQRAFNNDVITLKLERICNNKVLPVKRQRQHASEGVPTTPPADEIPDWFTNYMKDFKKEIVEQVTASVVDAISNVKIQALGRKLKENSTKRLHKSVESTDKEIRKTLKLERKIEELEERTNKIKEKKQALSSTTGLLNHMMEASVHDYLTLMNAMPVGPAEALVSNMSGGKIYRQEWIVTNTGSVNWTEETELCYAWGAEALKPIEKTVACPLLKPGDKGPVVVFLDVPSVPGEYKSYWHFSHNGRRFGHWLGCCIIVEPSPIKISAHCVDALDKSDTVQPPSDVSWSMQPERTLNLTTQSDKSVATVATTLENLTLVDLTLPSSDSDNQSIVSVADSSSSVHTAHSDDFVVVPIESENQVVAEAKEKDKMSRYAYVNFEGKKLAVPKALLRDDFLETAEEAKTPECQSKIIDKKRLFVFPLNCPGFEVVSPPNPLSESILASTSLTKTADEPSMGSVGVKLEEVATSLVENDEKENAPSTMFMSASSLYPNSTCMPVFPPPLNIPPPPPLNIPPPPMNIPLIPPCSVPVQTSLYTCTAPAYFSAPPNTTGPHFNTAFVPPLNPHYQYLPSDPFRQSFIHSNTEHFYPTSPQPPPQTEGDEHSTGTNSSAGSVPPTVHLIPDTLVSGAVNVASSAINTARSVLNMFSSTPLPQAHPMPPPPPPPSQPSQESAPVESDKRKKALSKLTEMGFWDRESNNVLLERFHDDLERVVLELIK